MLLTVKEVSEWLNIKPQTLYSWAAQGKIPCCRIHGLIRFDPEAVDEWLKGFDPARKYILPELARHDAREVDEIVAAAKRAVYTPPHGETRPKSGLIRKEDVDGAV
jgi:excisionase family DNA binding protein